MPDEEGRFTIIAAEFDADTRLDSFVASNISACSRKTAASLIQKGLIHVSGSVKKPGYRIKPGDTIEGILPAPQPVAFQPEPISLSILFEDTAIIIIDKAPGVVVHPAPGHYTGTLVNGLLFHCPDLSGIGGELRPGIVHRLDKDTSGVLAVAKSQEAHIHLASQFKSRKVNKRYLCVVHGEPKTDAGTIQLPIGRHPSDRKKMSVHSRKPRSAETQWRVRERFDGFALLDIRLKTGRTHQIRVHCAAIHHPVVGDTVYGGRKGVRKFKTEARRLLIKGISRQMLHAFHLGIIHPVTDEPMSFEAPVPEDMRGLIEGLRKG